MLEMIPIMPQILEQLRASGTHGAHMIEAGLRFFCLSFLFIYFFYIFFSLNSVYFLFQ